jgi:hypothetical protein
LIETVAEIEAHPAATLGEHEKHHVTLGADRIFLVGPCVDTVDQQTRQQMVQRRGLDPGADLARNVRSTSVRADDQAWPELSHLPFDPRSLQH